MIILFFKQQLRAPLLKSLIIFSGLHGGKYSQQYYTYLNPLNSCLKYKSLKKNTGMNLVTVNFKYPLELPIFVSFKFQLYFVLWPVLMVKNHHSWSGTAN